MAIQYGKDPRWQTGKRAEPAVHGQDVEVLEDYHRIVVARWIGTHPAIILEFEELRLLAIQEARRGHNAAPSAITGGHGPAP